MTAFRVIEASGSNGVIQFSTDGDFDSSPNFVFTTGSERMGIGVSDPLAKLHVSGSTIIGGQLTDLHQITGSAEFANPVSAFQGLSGSLTQLTDGTSYLIAGSNVAISSQSNGSITISSTGGGTSPGGADTNVQYNDGGLFGGNAGFTYDDANQRVAATHIDANLSLSASIVVPSSGDNSIQITSGTQNYSPTDTFLFVTGIIGAKEDNARGVSVFAGDVLVSGVHYVPELQFDTAATVTGHSTGRMFWDDGNKTVSLDMQGSDVRLQLGQEEHVYARNNSGVVINNGDAVRISGAVGGNVTVEKAISSVKSFKDEIEQDQILGVATEQIGLSQSGYITTFGAVRNLNTSTFAAGDILYLSSVTSGTYTNSRPAAPNFAARIGVVQISDAAEGVVLVRPQEPTFITDIAQITGSGVVAGGTSYLCYDDTTEIVSFTNAFTGSFFATEGLSGSLTQLTDGTSYLVAGTNVTITSESNGSVTISSVDTQADTYWDSTTNGSIFTTGSVAIPGAESVDSPSDKGTDVFFYVSGALDNTNRSLFGGDVYVSGTGYFEQGLSGSLTQLLDGTSYLVAGDGIAITTGSNGSVTITNDGTVGDITSVTAGNGLLGGGSSGDVTLEIDDSIVATVSGTTFTGATIHQAGLSGSLTQLADGTSYLIAGTNVTITSESNGAITISSVDTQADTYWDSTTNGSIFTTGSVAIPGAESVDSPLDKGTDVFFYVSGALDKTQTSLFGGDITASGSVNGLLGLSGSLTQLTDGRSYLVAGSNTTIVSESNGQITISSDTPADAQYVTLALNAELSNERVLTGGTGIDIVDGGANNNVTLNIDDSVVATVSGTTFTGATIHQAGLSGSLTQLADGTSYLIAGTNVTITSESNGAVTISSVDTQADTYWDSTTNGSIFTTGSVAIPGSESVDSPSDKGADVFFYVSGALNNTNRSLFGGDVYVSGTGYFEQGLSGSLTQLLDGTSYLIAGDGIAITTGSNGAVTITNDGTVGDITSVTAGNGLVGGGSSGDVTLEIDDSIVATVSGTTFTGATVHQAGLSGSLTQLADGTSYLIAGTNVTITSESNGAITISSIDTQADTYWDSTTNGSIFTTGSVAIPGAESVDAPSDKGTDVFFYVSGALDKTQTALFGGDITASGSVNGLLGLSGSLTQLTDGRSYLVAGSNVTIVSESNGQVTVSSDTPANAQYVTLALNAELTDERVLTGGTGIDIVDGGANSNVTLNIDDSVVATVSGTTFTGATIHQAGLSGSLTQLADGTSYLIAGDNVTITSESNGAVTISSTQADTYWDSTTNGSIFTTGSVAIPGSESVDSPDDKGTDVFFYVSGAIGSANGAFPGVSLFGGDVVISGSITALAGFSGSFSGSFTGDGSALTNVTASYVSSSVIEGGTVGEVLAVNGSGISEFTHNLVDATNTATLALVARYAYDGVGVISLDWGNRILEYPNGVDAVDWGTNNQLTITGSTNVSGTLNVTGDTSIESDLFVTGTSVHLGGLSGSLTQLADGTSYLIAGPGVTITSASNGPVTISSTAASVSTYWDSTTNGAIFTTGSVAIPGGDAGTIDDPTDKGTDVFFYVSGALDKTQTALFGGDVTASGSVNGLLGLSGSLTQLTDGTSYLIAGDNVIIASQSNGSVTVSSIQADTYWDSTTNGSIFTTGSVAIPGAEAGTVDAPSDKGTDVFFYVSGAINSAGGASEGVSVFGGDVSVSGSVRYYNSVTTPTTRITQPVYTATINDYRIGVRYTATDAVTIQLPKISDVGERDLRFKDEDGNAKKNNITIVASGSDLIDGDSTAILNRNYIAISLYNDGTSNWFIE